MKPYFGRADRGRMYIPVSIQRLLTIKDGDKFTFSISGNKIVVTPLPHLKLAKI